MPESLATEFYNRDYYGTLRHNSRAVYQYYFGWYDANPANLNPHPPVEAGTRYVELAGVQTGCGQHLHFGDLVFAGKWGDAAPWAVDPPGTRHTGAGPPSRD